MRRIFISDLHLQDPQADVFLRFSECLAAEAQLVDEIYILGDLVEMWIGDDDDSATAQALREVITATTKLAPVFIMHGNRDFLFGDDFCSDTGASLVTDPFLTNDGLLLSHGDALCTDDQEYQAMRTLLRSAAWQQDILSKSLDERKAFGQALRAQSQDSNANKATNIMDVNAVAIDQLMHSQGSQTLIHGHTHRPGMYNPDFGNEGVTRVVTGAWEYCGWLCRQQDEHLQLECFSLARRYGT